MSLELTPLDETTLSAPVRRVTGPSAPAALRLSVARGLAPLPPADVVVALYQIAVTTDGELADAARKTAGELPDAVLAAALSSAREPRVIDFFARCLLPARANSRPVRSKLIQALLLNQAAADETFAYLASVGSDAELELVGQNEQRMLRHPAIITQLYLNPKTRMSTATRAVELAVRNGVRPEGIASFEEIKAAIASDGVVGEEVDAAFNAVLAANTLLAPEVAAPAVEGRAAAEAAPLPEGEAPAEGEAPPVDEEARLAAIAAEADAAAEEVLAGAAANEDRALQIGKLPAAAKIRLATLGNTFARAILVRDSNKVVAMAAIRSPAVTEHEAELYAGNRGLNEDVIRYIASQRQFVKRYTTKFNLVNNPKCPLQAAMNFITHLTPKDLRAIARSKGIPSALARAAQGLIQKRESRGKD